MSEETRLGELEASIRSVEERQQIFKEVEPLLRTLEAILHFESVSTGLKKKASELVVRTEEARVRTAAVKVKAIEFISTADDSIREASKKREKDLKNMAAKAEAIDTGFKVMKEDAPNVGKNLAERVRLESTEVLQSFIDFNEAQKTAATQKIETLRVNVKQGLTESRAASNKALEESKKFDHDNSEKLYALKSSPADRTEPIEEAKNRFLGGIERKIDQEIQLVRTEFEARCKEFSTKHVPELMEIVAETEKIYGKHSSGNQPDEEVSPEAKLKRANVVNRRLLNHTGAYALTSLGGVETLLVPITSLLAEIKAISLTEHGLKLLIESGRQLEVCTNLLSSIAPNLTSDLQLLQAAFSTEAGLAQQIDNKGSLVLKVHERLEKEVKTRLESVKTAVETAQAEYQHWSEEQNEDLGVSDEDED